ncbi:MAG: TolC family protein [Actinomycetota bacterium]
MPSRPLAFFLTAALAWSPVLAQTANAAQAAPVPVLTQAEAIRMALQDSPTLAMARHERNVGLIDADRNRPAFRPEVTASASQTVRTPRVDLPGRLNEVVLPNAISRLEIGLRQPLFQFGAGGAPARRANAMAAAARSDYRKAELDTVQEVREAFLAAVRASEMSVIAAYGVELSRENVRVTRLQEERGFVAQVDVLDAVRAEAEAESQALQAANGAALARANLNRLLGRPIDTPFAVAAPDDLPADPGPLAELTGQAMRQRPEAETLRHQIEAGEAGIALAKAAGQPRVNLEAAYALQTPTALVPRSGIGVGLSITAPIFNGAVRRFSVREAEERVAQLRSALTSLEQGVALEIQKERLALQEARARITASERGVAAAEKAYEITRARLERGRALQVEVQNGRLSLERARAARAGAIIDLHLAHARLQRALGLGPEGPRM